MPEKKSDHTTEWLSYTSRDLLAAQRIFETIQSGTSQVTTQLAQQAAEKYIQALLTWMEIPFPYTHDIQRLVELDSAGSDLAAKLDSTFFLSQYATGPRYPGMSPPITRMVARRCIDKAFLVRKEILLRLKEEGYVKPKKKTKVKP